MTDFANLTIQERPGTLAIVGPNDLGGRADVAQIDLRRHTPGLSWNRSGLPDQAIFAWAMEQRRLQSTKTTDKSADADEAARVKKEKEWDLRFNEGGEGFNPHRSGAGHTYR